MLNAHHPKDWLTYDAQLDRLIEREIWVLTEIYRRFKHITGWWRD